MKVHALYLAGIVMLTACGGGGGGGGGGEAPEALLSGDYGFAELSGRMDPVVNTTLFGLLTADGAGAFATTFGYNADGDVGSSTQDYVYSVSASRELVLEGAMDPHLRGRVSTAGHLAGLSGMYQGVSPGVRVLLRRGAGLDAADLQGTYRTCELAFITGLGKPEGIVGTYTFHGSGNFTGSLSSNIDGFTFGPDPIPPGSYTVSPTGNCELTYSSGFGSRGQLLPSGDVLCVAGGTHELEHQRLACFIREGSGMNVTNLSGTYCLVGLFYDFSAGVEDYVGIEGTLTADGAGAYTATFRRNVGTFVSAGTTQENGTYTVSATGLLTIHRSDGQTYEGGLSPDLSFGMYGGGISSGSRPGIYFFVK